MLMARKESSQTCGNQSELVFLIPNFLFFHISSGEEKTHHPLEELVHELNGEWYHIYLQMKTFFRKKRTAICVIKILQCYDVNSNGFHGSDLKVLFDGNPSNRGADFTEDA